MTTRGLALLCGCGCAVLALSCGQVAPDMGRPTPPPAPAPGAPAETITLPSGLQYIDLEIGAGPQAILGQTVTVHYTGWLTNGTQFDSSVDRNQPFQFTLGAGNVISGWDEGVATMRVGGRRQLTVPPHLAYGEQAIPPEPPHRIPPYSTLIFDVQLLAAG